MAEKFDLKVQINERLLNKLVYAAYYVEKFSISGPPLVGPNNEQVFIKVESVPLVNLRRNEAELVIFPKITIKRMNRSDLVLGIRIVVGVDIEYRKSTRQLELKLVRGSLRFFYDNREIGAATNQEIESILSTVLTVYLHQHLQKIGFSWDLIGIDGFTFEFGGIKIEDERLSVGLNLKGYSGGSINRLQNYVGKEAAASALSEDGLNRFIGELRRKGLLPSHFHDSGRVNIPIVDLVRPLLGRYMPFRLLERVIQQITLSAVEVRYSWDADIDRDPIIDFESSPQTQAKMRFQFSIQADVEVVAIFTVLRIRDFWKLVGNLFGKKNRRRRYQYPLRLFSYRFGPTEVKVKATGSLALIGSRVKPRIKRLRISAQPVVKNIRDLLPIWKKLTNPSFALLETIGYAILNVFPGEIQHHLNDKLEPISIPLHTITIPGSPEIELNPKVTKFYTTSNQVIVVVDATVNHVTSYWDNKMPPFICNKVKKELHKNFCPWIKLMAQRNMIPVYYPDEVLATCDPCDKCFGGSKR